MKNIQPTTLADQAYLAIKEAITRGEFLEHEVLPEEKMAKRLGISRTPLRDALNRLASEGLIVQSVGKPAIVAGFNKKNTLETMELRGLLEVNNLEKISPHIDETFIAQLRDNIAAQTDAILTNKYDLFIERDREFHLLLASKNTNIAYKDLIAKVNASVNRSFLMLSTIMPQSAHEALIEHKEIIDALEQRDITHAKNKMIVHMNNVEKRFLTYYNNKKI